LINYGALPYSDRAKTTVNKPTNRLNSQERLADRPGLPPAASAEAALRNRVQYLITALNGQFGKVMAELIAEGQSDPTVLHELHERHISTRRDTALAEIERGKASGELSVQLDAGLLLEAVFGAIYFRLLLRSAPLDAAFGERLVDQALAGYKKTAKTAAD